MTDPVQYSYSTRVCVSRQSRASRGGFFFPPAPLWRADSSYEGSPAPAVGGVTSLSDPVAALKNALIFILEKKC